MTRYFGSDRGRLGRWLSLALLVGIASGCEPGAAPPAKPGTASHGGSQALAEVAVGGSGEAAEAQAQAATVRVRVGRGPDSEWIEGTVPWQADMTVFDAISRFSPSLDVESTGQGETLFVKSIAGQKNLGSAGDNWIYRVNGQLGDRSCAVYPVAAGDEVVWSFGKYE
jgi:hypothetical protein